MFVHIVSFKKKVESNYHNFSYIALMGLKNRLLHNIINFITENDINPPANMTFNTGSEIIPPHGSELWKFVISIFEFDKLTLYLINSLRDSVVNEDYLLSHNLKIEIEEYLELSEATVHAVGLKLINEFHCSTLHSDLLSDIVPNTIECGIVWNAEGISELPSINAKVDQLRKHIYTFNSQEIGDEAVDFIIDIGCSHPVLLIDKLQLYFSLLSTDN